MLKHQKLATKLLLINIATVILMTIICLQFQDEYNNDSQNMQPLAIENNKSIVIKSSLQPPLMTNANCSTSWRKQYQIPINNQQLNESVTKYLGVLELYHGRVVLCRYKFNRVPKGTFTYWLSHIESQNRISDKAYFADKYLMKEYIRQYKIKFPLFNKIKHAQILYDFVDGTQLSFDEFIDLKHKYNRFLIKPNHFSGKQIIVNANETITYKRYKEIMRQSHNWLKRKYKQKSNGINRESWYELIEPHRFIEENINIHPPLTEYKINVFNYKALFLYVKQEDAHQLNLYILPEVDLLDVFWCVRSRNKSISDQVRIPSKTNLRLMMDFAEHFARREKWKYVRVDLYEINGTIYFSEFTFMPISGTAIMRPISFDYLLYDILCDNNQTDYDEMYEYLL